MGRPPLDAESKTRLTGVRLTDDQRARIIALVGPQGMAAFIREAIEAALKRFEKRADD